MRYLEPIEPSINSVVLRDRTRELRGKTQVRPIAEITEAAVKHVDDGTCLERVDLQLENGLFWRLTFKQFPDEDAPLSWFNCQGGYKKRVALKLAHRSECCL